MTTPLLIAEFGSSPAPDWDLDAWCGVAKFAGASAVKVQLFRAEHFPKAEQESKKRIEFPRYLIYAFVTYAHHYNMLAGASGFDADALKLIVDNCDFLKLACREMRNGELIARALNYYGKVHIYQSIDDLTYLSSLHHLTSLYAIQQYPAPMVKSIWKLIGMAYHARYTCEWGWSSHTQSGAECILAARLGASVIERHFCLNENDIEAGHSSLPADFKRIAERIK